MCEWRASGRAVGEQWRRDNSKKRRVAREQAPARLTGQRVSTPQDGGLITAKLAQAGGSRFCQEHLLACKKLSSLRQSRRRYAFASTTSIARDLALVLFRDFHRHRFHALDSIACDLALCPSLQSPSTSLLSLDFHRPRFHRSRSRSLSFELFLNLALTLLFIDSASIALASIHATQPQLRAMSEFKLNKASWDLVRPTSNTSRRIGNARSPFSNTMPPVWFKVMAYFLSKQSSNSPAQT